MISSWQGDSKTRFTIKSKTSQWSDFLNPNAVGLPNDITLAGLGNTVFELSVVVREAPADFSRTKSKSNLSFEGID